MHVPVSSWFRLLFSAVLLSAGASTDLQAGTPAVAAGNAHSLFLDSQGTVFAAGWNESGQLGMQLTPAVVGAWQKAQFGIQAENSGISGWDADPDGDGVPNLLERAFNLPPLVAGTPELLAAGGTAGLPSVMMRQRTGGDGGAGEAGPVLVVRFLRLKKFAQTEALVYTTQFSSDPGLDEGWTSVSSAAQETVESLDADWERVTVEDSVAASPARRFARVKVTLPTENP